MWRKLLRVQKRNSSRGFNCERLRGPTWAVTLTSESCRSRRTGARLGRTHTDRRAFWHAVAATPLGPPRDPPGTTPSFGRTDLCVELHTFWLHAALVTFVTKSVQTCEFPKLFSQLPVQQLLLRGSFYIFRIIAAAAAAAVTFSPRFLLMVVQTTPASCRSTVWSPLAALWWWRGWSAATDAAGRCCDE